MSENKIKLKYLCESFNSAIIASTLKAQGKTAVYGASGLSGYSDNDGISKEYLGIVKDGAGVGRITQYKAGTLLVGTMSYIFPKKDCDINWLKYCIASLNLGDSIDKATIPHIYFSDYGNRSVLNLSREGQKITANFLEGKSSLVDQLISNQEKQIEKLKEYRQAIITKAVTKGLDPNVPMKDSGVEWIGEIPTLWNYTNTKYLFSIIAGGTPNTDDSENFDGNVIWITPADYKTEDVYVSKGKRNLSDKGLSSCSASKVPVGSIIFSKRAPIGSVAINSVPLCTNQGCLSCVSNKVNLNTKYFYYVMSVLTEKYELLGSGTTFKEISAKNFEIVKLPYPPRNEQDIIVKYLDSKCEKIKFLIKVKEIKIQNLQAYKQSLIYEYVTGKRRVCL